MSHSEHVRILAYLVHLNDVCCHKLGSVDDSISPTHLHHLSQGWRTQLGTVTALRTHNLHSKHQNNKYLLTCLYCGWLCTLDICWSLHLSAKAPDVCIFWVVFEFYLLITTYFKQNSNNWCFRTFCMRVFRLQKQIRQHIEYSVKGLHTLVKIARFCDVKN